MGATTLIIDEDTSATNFLVRDSKMHELVLAEPITPLVSKVEALFRDKSVSTLIVIGGCGDYLSPATTVIGMEAYRAHDWTSRAHEIAQRYPNPAPPTANYGSVPGRTISLSLTGDKPPMARGTDRIIFRAGRDNVAAQDSNPEVDISALEQLVEAGQANLCAEALRVISDSGSVRSVRDWVSELEKLMEEKQTNIRGESCPRGSLARTRPLEVMAVVNRVRGLRVTNGTQVSR